MPPEVKLTQYQMVERVMRTGFWWSLPGIRAALHGRAMEAAISARLREMRAKGWLVERRATAKRGLYEYRCTRP
jgi:hypothetical protein